MPDAEMRGATLSVERRGLELHLRNRLDDVDAARRGRRRQRGVGNFLTAGDRRLDVVLRHDPRPQQNLHLAVGLERRQRGVDPERAVQRAERDRGAVGVRGWPCPAEPPEPRTELGNANGSVLPSSGASAPEKPHLMPSSLANVLRRAHDARLDLDLQLRRVEVDDQLRGAIEPELQVGDDQRVGARVDVDLAALGQRRLGEQRRQVRRLGVVQRLRDRHAARPRAPARRPACGATRLPRAATSTGAMRTIVPSTV